MANLPVNRFVPKIINFLTQNYPSAKCTLDFSDPWQLLVATVLSAQCTDVRVNQITPKLFSKYPRVDDMARGSRRDLERIIKPAGFYRSKANHLLRCSRIIVAQYQSKVPDEMKSLVELPGVGRKTANVILGNAFGKAEGMAVDTHVARVARRLGLVTSDQDTPLKIEKQLCRIVPRAQWTLFSHQLIQHGRQICKARSPKCDQCGLEKECPQLIW